LDLWDRLWAALHQLANAQCRHLAGADPILRFFQLLASAIASGEAHLAASNGGPPAKHAKACGWRPGRGRDAFSESATDLESRCSRVGWIVSDEVYLDPVTALRLANKMDDGRNSIPWGSGILAKRLGERGLLANTESSRGHLTVRKLLEQRRRAVWHVQATSLWPEEPAQLAHGYELDA
jgi:hypothetical protein